jgi:histidinol-phosphate aminotransferase
MSDSNAPLTPRPGIMEIAPYVPGEAMIAGHAHPAQLAANENALGPGADAISAYRAGADSLHRYPDSGALALTQAIADAHGLDPTRIVCGAGSDEILALLGRAYAGPGDEVLYTAHGFLMYPIIARSVGATPVQAPEEDLTANVDQLLEAVTEKTKIVFLANPNNPTGTMLSGMELRRLRAGLPSNVLLVIDAAYAEYVDDPAYEGGAALVDDSQNTVMTRTFSKIHGLAALRLGWCYAPADVISVLHRIRGPFNVTAPAIAAGAAAITDAGHVERSRAHNRAERQRLRDRLAQLGLSGPEGHGNFLLIQFADPERAEAALQAMNAAGVIPRRVAGYGLPECLRITVGTAVENDSVITALTDFVGVS